MIYKINSSDLDAEMKVILEKSLSDSSSNADMLLEIIRYISAQLSLCIIICSDNCDGDFLKNSYAICMVNS